jgi:hypothetical protein
MLLADRGIGVQWVAVRVEAGEHHSLVGEDREVVVASALAGDDVVDRDVDRWKEATCVDLCRVEAERGDHVERVGQRSVVEDRGVDAELHDKLHG